MIEQCEGDKIATVITVALNSVLTSLTVLMNMGLQISPNSSYSSGLWGQMDSTLGSIFQG